MAEILHHLVCKNPTNNGRSYLSTGAGFQPSTVGRGEKIITDSVSRSFFQNPVSQSMIGIVLGECQDNEPWPSKNLIRWFCLTL